MSEEKNNSNPLNSSSRGLDYGESRIQHGSGLPDDGKTLEDSLGSKAEQEIDRINELFDALEGMTHIDTTASPPLPTMPKPPVVDNTIDGTEGLVRALRNICKDYDNLCQQAAKQGGNAYVGCDIDSASLLGLINNPSLLTSSNPGSEPCYFSLQKANNGMNDDGTPHGGYIVIDVATQKIADLIDETGATRIPPDFIVSKHLSSHDIRGTDAQILATEMGKYVLTEDRGNYKCIYASINCMCNCFDGAVFPSERMAKKQKKLLDQQSSNNTYEVEEINQNFLQTSQFLRR